MSEQWLDGIPIDGKSNNAGPFTGGPRKIVVHTTEGINRPTYTNGMPHLDVVVLPTRTGWRNTRLSVLQYIPKTVGATALRNREGGVQTNRDSAYQIELVGTCSPKMAARYPQAFFWPGASDEILKDLGTLLRFVAQDDQFDVDVLNVAADWSPLSDNGYAIRSTRFDMAQWDNFTGICGHQHVPENDHVDPGGLPVKKALDLSLPKPGSALPNLPAKPVTPTPAPVPTPGKAPAFPLPRGHWFGRPSRNPLNHSGYYNSADRAKIRVWQQRLRTRGWGIRVTGLFDEQTLKVVLAFQKEKRLTADGLVGPRTYAMFWAAPVTK